MLPIQALPALLAYFDDVDATVATKLMRKRPWFEVALTQLLCDLLDEETADEYRRSYTLEQFRSELSLAAPLIEYDCSLATHQYTTGMERWVTQSDIGLIISYIDHFMPDRSWKASWLLQAKRLYPRQGIQHGIPVYDEGSGFGAKDPDQHARILALNDMLGYDMVKYLLYCPRSGDLDELTAAKLSHLRTLAFAGEIFDFASGLALYRELERGGTTMSAGLIVAAADSLPATLGAAHAAAFRTTMPLSWFLALQLVADRGALSNLAMGLVFDDAGEAETAARLASGDVAVVRDIQRLAGRDAGADPFPVLPAHTLRISVAVGGQADPERRRIQIG